MENNIVLKHLISIILLLYGDSSIPRKLVQTVLDQFTNLIINTIFCVLKNEIFIILKNENIPTKKIEKCFSNFEDIFKSVNSEHKRLKILEKYGMISFDEYVVDSTLEEQNISGNKNNLITKNIYAIHVPLQSTLKSFLELPGVFKSILDYIQDLQKEKFLITNILQGDLWLRKYSKCAVDGILLPIYVYFDDFESGNPLGSHSGKNKFGAIYAWIACLPPKFSSRISSIIFTGLIKTTDKALTTNEKVFKKLIDELNVLRSEGILINVFGDTYKVYFQLILLLGDNLGLNSICGMVDGFKANCICRICKITSEDLKKACVEDESLLRNPKNYDEDLLKSDVTNTGIKEKCTFNKVNGYHMADNIYCDILHDIFEGVSIYVLGALINQYIKIKKYFTTEELNSRIKNFNFGPSEKANKPPEISYDNLKNRYSLRFSAAEMQCFTRYFGLIIGDLVPEDDELWQLYIFLRKIVGIVTSPRVIRAHAKELKFLVKNLCALYIKHVGHLTPKFHNLLHYPRILLECGPLINFWTSRAESKHQPLKAAKLQSRSSKNSIKTIATKEMLSMCNRLNTYCNDDRIKFSTISKKDNNQNLKQCDGDIINFYDFVEIDGTLYTIGSIVLIDLESSFPKFGKIEKIYKLNDLIFFSLLIYEAIGFHEHYHAYLVNSRSNILDINYYDLPIFSPCLLINKEEHNFIATRYFV